MAIKSFKDKETAAAFAELPVRSHPPDIRKRALAKLQQLDAALSLEDLRVPPSNRLDALSGDRKGQHSIRINQQWRICFVFGKDGAEDVDISKHYE
ncbi:MAG: type II toxin-antitoxin system RelE/ParE family toxin [Terracidiphilus sp.]